MKNVLLLMMALLLAPFAMQAQTIEFADDFENGTAGWVLEGTWNTTNIQSNSSSNSLTDSPVGNYAANTNISATLANGIDLTDALDANLNFSAIYAIEGGNFDFCYVEASPDGGATWLNLATFLGPDNLGAWVDYSYSLGGLVGNDNVLVRFRMESDGGLEFDGIYIDDVEITSSNEDNAAPFVLHTPPDFLLGSLNDVVMTAEIVDVSGVATNTLNYALDGVASGSVEGVNAGGDSYSYTIPAQAAGVQVDYSLTVFDASGNANSITTPTFSHIAGNHIVSDNTVVDFFNLTGGAATTTETGVAVRVSLIGQDIAYALIRNYTDMDNTNNDFTFHLWDDNNGVPGNDLVAPFTVTPAATLDNNSPMTRIDLRAFSTELAGITGDVFVGYTVAAGEVVANTQTTPALFNLSFAFDGTTWTQQVDDYHFRVVTGPATAADDCANATDLSGLLGGGVDVPSSSPTFDNTNATVSMSDAVPACWNDATLENTQWFTFTGDGLPYNITTTNCGGTASPYNDDTQMVVYSGNNCGDLTELTCNEDISGTDFASTVTVETEAGTTYYIMLDGWDGTVGQYCLDFLEVTVVGCDEIALGQSSSPNTYTCLGATTNFILDSASVVIPDAGPTRGFRWIVSTADVTGSANPFMHPSYFGTFNESPTAYSPALVNDLTQIMAGTYFFTPVVYAGATGAVPAEYDFTDGCIITGTSVMMTLLDAVEVMTATGMSSDETSDVGNNGEASVMASGGTGDYTYEWDNGENTATITGLSAGDYTVTITDASGCTDPITAVVTVDLLVGVGDVDFAQAIRLFPNPAKDLVTIEYSFEDSRQLIIQVTNAVGQIVHQQVVPQGALARVQLDLTDYANGIYFVEFNDGENQLTRRLVVNK